MLCAAVQRADPMCQTSTLTPTRRHTKHRRRRNEPQKKRTYYSFYLYFFFLCAYCSLCSQRSLSLKLFLFTKRIYSSASLPLVVFFYGIHYFVVHLLQSSILFLFSILLLPLLLLFIFYNLILQYAFIYFLSPLLYFRSIKLIFIANDESMYV